MRKHRHMHALLPLLQKYKIAVPEYNAFQYAQMPASLKNACKAGIEGEINHIAMYDKFLEIPNFSKDVKFVMMRVKDASKIIWPSSEFCKIRRKDQLAMVSSDPFLFLLDCV
jgi:hypothetical protein